MKHIKVMDVILAFLAVALVAFTVTMILVHCETGSTPDTLIISVFAIAGGECGAMAWIRTSKERHQDRRWQIEDRETEQEEQE